MADPASGESAAGGGGDSCESCEEATVRHTMEAPASGESAAGGGGDTCESCEEAAVRHTCADCGVKACSECMTGDVCGTCQRQFCGDCGADFLCLHPSGNKIACWDCIWEGLILLEAKNAEKEAASAHTVT